MWQQDRHKCDLGNRNRPRASKFLDKGGRYVQPSVWWRQEGGALRSFVVLALFVTTWSYFARNAGKGRTGAAQLQPVALPPTADDLLLVDLMNEMINLRQQLEELRSAENARPVTVRSSLNATSWFKWRRRMPMSESSA